MKQSEMEYLQGEGEIQKKKRNKIKTGISWYVVGITPMYNSSTPVTHYLHHLAGRHLGERKLR